MFNVTKVERREQIDNRREKRDESEPEREYGNKRENQKRDQKIKKTFLRCLIFQTL
jgi:hypothetical protein